MMQAVFEFNAGTTPLLISIPHDGRYLPPEIASRLNDTGRAIPDTDWNVIRLYEFARKIGAGIIAANYSRYVVDLNRSANDEALYAGQLSTGLCPVASFSGEPIYRTSKAPDDREKRARVEACWRPYHDKLSETLDKTRARFGYALLWDAHSIPGQVPLLFDGSLPDLNIGTNDGRSCSTGLELAVSRIAKASQYSSVVNGRFKGGFITRRYGDPHKNVHAIQLELAQRCYMDEQSLHYDDDAAAALAHTIEAMLREFLSSAAELYAE
jgi:N-formylglutamate amidohydrolase